MHSANLEKTVALCADKALNVVEPAHGTAPSSLAHYSPPALHTASEIITEKEVEHTKCMISKHIPKFLHGHHFSPRYTCVGDLDVFGPPESGSVSQRYGSVSFPFLINVLSGLKYCLQNTKVNRKFIFKAVD